MFLVGNEDCLKNIDCAQYSNAYFFKKKIFNKKSQEILK